MSSIQKVKQKLIEVYATREFHGFRATEPFSVRDTLREDYPYVREDGTLAFPDVLGNSTDRSKWRSTTHLSRLFLMAREWYNMKDGEEKERIYEKILLPLLDHWLIHDFKSTNWWFNEICIPAQFGEIGLFLFDRLDAERKEKFLAIFGRGSFGPRPELMKNWTGANLLWFSYSSILYAALTGDDALLKTTVGRAAEEIAFGREGMQKDGSFFQHGPRLYSCGYGISFVATISKEIFVLSGTEFQFPKEKLELFLFHLLDGVRYMTHKDSVDYCTVGREYSRQENKTCKNHSLIPALSLLSRVPEMPRKDEIDAFFEAYKNKKTAVQGIRVFEDAMLLTSHLGDTYISVRGMSPDLWDEEICNSEGILGYNLSYGTHTTVMRSGDEYLDMSALWDYARMPGTTARYETEEQLLARPDFTKRAVSGKAFGCGKIGDCGYIVMDFSHETVSGKFAALATPWGTVLFGRDFADSEGARLFTTAEQCRLCGDISLSDDEKTFTHNGVTYDLLVGGKFSYTAEKRQGNYKRNNVCEKDVPYAGDVLTLSVEREENAYAYAIFPSDCQERFTVSGFTAEKADLILPDGREIAVDFKSGSCRFMK